MNIKRFWTIFKARNKEYYRDRASFGWNFMFPFLIILGFYIIFERGGQVEYKAALIPSKTQSSNFNLEKYQYNNYFKFIEFSDPRTAFDKLSHHKLDIIIEKGSEPVRYWINNNSPNGELAESIFLRNFYDKKDIEVKVNKQFVSGKQVNYIDWFFPGIISMNMMFSALFGVGFTVVRYRKNGTLKRFKATPLTAFEYLGAQIVSRLMVIITSTSIMFTGCTLLFHFNCEGSYINLLLFYSLGTLSVISLGLIVAARINSEELANGLLNIITWPMMFLSEVWFSLEGAPTWLKNFAQIFPLTHVTNGLRKIMNEGAGFSGIQYEIFILVSMTIVFLLIGSFTFKWLKD